MYDGISVVTQASYEPFVIESQLLSSGVRFMDVDFAGCFPSNWLGMSILTV